MRKSEIDGRQEILKRVRISVIMSLLSIVITVIVLFLLSLLIENESLPSKVSETGSSVVIILATFIASLITVNRLQSKTLVSGLSVSLITVLLLLIGSLFFKGRGEPSIIIIGSCLAAGAASGLIGGIKCKVR